MYKLLVADDEMLVRKGIVCETDWKALGFGEILEASNGREALEMIRSEKPDLIISDIRMPKMNGIEMLKAMREENNDAPVIFLTAYSEFEYAREALKLYAFDYILKPFEDGELEAAVLRAKKRILQSRGEKEETEKTENPLLPFDENSPGLSGYVREAVRYMTVHYGESEITVAQIADSVGISEGHLSHCFKKETGYTVMAWLTRYRIQSAMKLLSDYRNKVYEAAEQVGYRDIAYFSSTFKKITGMSPSEYQNRR